MKDLIKSLAICVFSGVLIGFLIFICIDKLQPPKKQYIEIYKANMIKSIENNVNK